MSGLEISTIKIDPKDGDLGKVEATNANVLESVDLKKVLVQVLRRPTDALNQTLEESLYGWVAAGMAVQPVRDRFGGWIDVARNWQTQLFMKARDYEFLMMVDCDVGCPMDIPILLARHNLPVVTAAVPAYTHEKGLFLCFAVKGPDGKARFPTLRHAKCLPANGLLEVHNTGAGCLMVRRDVLETLWSKYDSERELECKAKTAIMEVLEGRGLQNGHREALWALLKKWNYVEDMSGPPFSIPQSVRDKAAETGVLPRGEDICFTDRVRAAGIKMYVDFAARCTHDKLMTAAWPNDRLDPDLSVEDWAISVFDEPVEQK